MSPYGSMPESLSQSQHKSSADWWRGAIIYQIYPRSFADANGDGVGDLRGVIEHLDHVARLGVDAIWLSPFFPSPMADFGYDVSDYRGVDPLFGTLEDFKALVDAAHARGLRVMIDQVLSHSSDQHPWFDESRRSRDNPKADWYVWADAQADGSPPNNWLSIFGGSAWAWDARRCQYYLHNFLKSQPDLNFHHPEVRAAMLDVLRFWLDLGVDGFRLDTVNFYFHDALLRSNPPVPPGVEVSTAPRTNPYVYQDHVYDKTRPENLAFLEEMRRLMDAYPGTALVGELGADNDQGQIMSQYTEAGRRLHMAYSFRMLTPTFSSAYLQTVIGDYERYLGNGWPAWAFSNHDVPRVISRWGLDAHAEQATPLLVALLTSLRGSVCLYQGEELGLSEADVPFELLQDPYGIEFWPEFKGRDGCRTPMPWTSAAPAAGFSSGTPWLPVPQDHRAKAVSLQWATADSSLSRVARFLAWRQAQPALRHGSLSLLPLAEPLLGFIRRQGDETIVAIFNLGLDAQSVDLRSMAELCVGGELKPLQATEAESNAGFSGRVEAGVLHLAGLDAVFLRAAAVAGSDDQTDQLAR